MSRNLSNLDTCRAQFIHQQVQMARNITLTPILLQNQGVGSGSAIAELGLKCCERRGHRVLCHEAVHVTLTRNLYVRAGSRINVLATFFPFFCCFASFSAGALLLLDACAEPRVGKPSSSASWGCAEPLLEPWSCGRLELHASHDRVLGPFIRLHLPKQGIVCQQRMAANGIYHQPGW